MCALNFTEKKGGGVNFQPVLEHFSLWYLRNKGVSEQKQTQKQKLKLKQILKIEKGI